MRGKMAIGRVDIFVDKAAWINEYSDMLKKQMVRGKCQNVKRIKFCVTRKGMQNWFSLKWYMRDLRRNIWYV